MKKLLTSLTLTAVLCLAVQLPAQVSVINLSATNSIAVNTTISENMGNAVNLERHKTCGIEARFQGSAAGTTDVIYLFRLSSDGTTYETGSTFKFSLAQNGTTAVVGVTNVPETHLGAFKYMKLYSVQNQDADAVLTNHSVRIILKK